MTGVDYFSTLGYQPSIAFVAAGFLSPFATLVLVLLTLAGALPVYRRIAALSPNGQGSLSVLEDRLPRWRGKAMVLCLLGFAATSFIITITLSAADATAHIIENPFTPAWMRHPVVMTVLLVTALGGVFLKGFREAIWLAVALVAVYLVVNVIIVGWEVIAIVRHPSLIAAWRSNLYAQQPEPWMWAGLSVLLFPKLALGLSGFETGVAVMPLVAGDGDTDEARLQSRIANTRKLLTTAACIMSVLLIGSSLAVTMQVPAAALVDGGEADGRALAYLAHRDLGHGFGTLYDLATIGTLWFAGASALAGLLNLVPQYLPRYGMAPAWARATRPLVLVITAICIVVTIAFDADVNKQGGAYATGVLVLITSAAIAVTLAQSARRRAFFGIAAIFVYTTVVNVIEKPEGAKIAGAFIVGIILSSLVSRVARSMELRIEGVEYDEVALGFIHEAAGRRSLRIIASRPNGGTREAYQRKFQNARHTHHLPATDVVLFLEVRPGDASAFSEVLHVSGVRVGEFRILRCTSPAVPNAIAGLLLDLRDRTYAIPHAYFGWTEGNPITYVLRFLAFGEGDTAPVCREVLRQAEPDPMRRPRIHVG
ncbi:MAG: amino acid transporter [Acidobacteria bacterium]|nr:amino acid transporter [Acidobacteriota bacterium]